MERASCRNGMWLKPNNCADNVEIPKAVAQGHRPLVV